MLCELSVGVGGGANFAEVEPNDTGRPRASMVEMTGGDNDPGINECYGYVWYSGMVAVRSAEIGFRMFSKIEVGRMVM